MIWFTTLAIQSDGTRLTSPRDPEDHSRIVVSCGKSNDAKPFHPMGMKLNDKTMLYKPDSSFDLNAWKNDVEGKRSTANFTLSEVAKIIDRGISRIAEIHSHLGGPDAGSRRSLERILAKGKQERYFRSGANGYFLTRKEEGIIK